MVVTVEQRKSRRRRDSIWAIINSYIVLITENLTISTSMYVSDGMCTAEILVFHLHKNFTLLSVNGKKWTKSNKNLITKQALFVTERCFFIKLCVCENVYCNNNKNNNNNQAIYHETRKTASPRADKRRKLLSEKKLVFIFDLGNKSRHTHVMGHILWTADNEWVSLSPSAHSADSAWLANEIIKLTFNVFSSVQ